MCSLSRISPTTVVVSAMNSWKVVKICGLTMKLGFCTLLVRIHLLAPSGVRRKSLMAKGGKRAEGSADPCGTHSVSKLNSSSTRYGGDHISVLRIDEPGDDGLFGLHQLKTVGYEAVTEDGSLDAHGFDVEIMSDSSLRFWMINHRPPVDQNNRVLDATKLGANSTIEVFEVTRGSDEMVHLKTISHKAIATPNNLAATGDGGIFFTNDHSSKGEKSYAPKYWVFVG